MAEFQSPPQTGQGLDGVVAESWAKLIQAFERYPKDVSAITRSELEVIHLSRGSNFFAHSIKWTRQNGWQGQPQTIPEKSGLLFVRGSGAKEFYANFHKKYDDGPNHGTSRNVFHCFVDTLFTIKDKFCGGAPQLAGLIRKAGSNGQKFGIIVGKKRYFFGAEITNLSNFENIPWRNDFFEVCDGRTMKRMQGYDLRTNRLKGY